MTVLEMCVAMQSLVNKEYMEGAEHPPLWGHCVEDQHSGGGVSYLNHLEVARQEVQSCVRIPTLTYCIQNT